MIFRGKGALAPMYAGSYVFPDKWRKGDAGVLAQTLRPRLNVGEFFYLAIPAGRKFRLMQKATGFELVLLKLTQATINNRVYDVYRNDRPGLGLFDIQLQYIG